MNDAPSGTDLRFPSTCWSRMEADAPAALEVLAQRYWRPIHAYLRCALRRSDADARDLAQDFFVWMIETSFVHKADPSRGRFRAFLKTALRRYVGDQDARARARKRGGGRRFVPLASDDPTTTALELPSGDRTPDQVLDDAWRAEVIAQALARTESELAARGQERVFAVFRDYFLDPADGVDYAAIAARHGITTTDVSNWLQRAKATYRAHLRALIADTVHGGRDLDDELAWLVRRAPR
jgi:RNA polymerase sigma-70 factor (ECF subfamily)